MCVGRLLSPIHYVLSRSTCLGVVVEERGGRRAILPHALACPTVDVGIAGYVAGVAILAIGKATAELGGIGGAVGSEGPSIGDID